MSAIDTRLSHVPAAPGAVSTVFSTVQGWIDARATRKALHRLSDRELDDIGLTRGDIDRVARGF